MYTVSALFQQYNSQPGRDFEVQALIAGVLYGASAVIDFTIEDSIVPGEELTLGSVISSKLILALKTTDTIPPNAKITPQIRLNGTSGPTEWVPLGDYYVDTREFQNDVWRFTCFDRLLVSNQSYVSSLIFPNTMQLVWNELMGQLGLSSDASVIIDPAYMIPYEPLDYSMRDIIGFIASAHGANIGMTKDGLVKFIPMVSGVAPINIGTSGYINANRANTTKIISKIILTYNTDGEELSIGSGSDPETLRLFNPFMDEAMLTTLFTEINGFSYDPFVMSWRGNPSVEVGDAVLVTQRDSSTIASTILTNKISFKGGMIVVSTAPSQSENQSETDYKVNLRTFIRDNAVIQDKPYYGVTIGREHGIKITRSDGATQALFNSDFLKFIGINNTLMLNEWGFNPDFIKRFPNKIINSSFEWYDVSTLKPEYWVTNGEVTVNSNWDGTVAMMLQPTQYCEQGMLTTVTHAGADPGWWEDKQTRVSFKHRGGAIRVKVIKVIDGLPYTLTDNSGSSEGIPDITGAFIDYPAAPNWDDGYVSFYFTPETNGGRVKIRFENNDTGLTDYIDAVQMEPDFTGLWPSLYSHGPRSLPMNDILSMPGAGGIFAGLDAEKPLFGSTINSFSFNADALGFRFSDQTFWAGNVSSLRITKFNKSGVQLDSWSIGENANGCEIDGDDDDILWLTDGGPSIFKYRISTKTFITSFTLSDISIKANGIAAPAGPYLWVGDPVTKALYKVNKITGAIVPEATIPINFAASGVAWDGHNVWVSYTDTTALQGFDPVTGLLVREIDGPGSSLVGLTYDGAHLWVANNDNDTVVELSDAPDSFSAMYYATDTNKIYWNVNNTWVFAGTGTHSRLNGLNADDHLQYLNELRHDVIERHTLGDVVPHDTFLGLSDSPADYVGQAGKAVIVNATEDGVEFGSAPSSGGGGGVGAYSETIGDGTSTIIDIIHGLGTPDLLLQMWDLSGASPTLYFNPSIPASTEIVDVNTVRLTFTVAPAVDSFRVDIIASGAVAGVATIKSTGNTGLSGDIEIAAGANITLVQDDILKKITIAATSGGGGGTGFHAWTFTNPSETIGESALGVLSGSAYARLTTSVSLGRAIRISAVHWVVGVAQTWNLEIDGEVVGTVSSSGGVETLVFNLGGFVLAAGHHTVALVPSASAKIQYVAGLTYMDRWLIMERWIELSGNYHAPVRFVCESGTLTAF